MIHKLGRLGSGQPCRPTEWVEGGGGCSPPDSSRSGGGGAPHVTGGGDNKPLGQTELLGRVLSLNMTFVLVMSQCVDGLQQELQVTQGCHHQVTQSCHHQVTQGCHHQVRTPQAAPRDCTVPQHWETALSGCTVRLHCQPAL